ncbi:arginase family protein [Mesorhizobium sp. RP14(2022)]|uniref:Arginase family protein n=1 Tax=Mesorhizobium liriopis TaxID=2953882 RepID=A0ABT1CBB0_9HYPH|nr:arginase family protein [Mesorhizobium liriopis]MCO6052112.1 arginase family protein [Mesorhizobium liriopis]
MTESSTAIEFNTPRWPFFGASLAAGAEGCDAAIFGAPHGTPYPEIDNRPYASAADTLRHALHADADWAGHWNWDFDAPMLGDNGFRLLDLGDLRTAPGEGEANRDLIEQAVRKILDVGAVPIMIGGDDSVPIPFISAFSDQAPLTILQIDAHIDWREERRGEPLGFSSTMRRASEMSHVTKIVQVGMRGLGSARREEVEAAKAWGVEFIPARDVHTKGIAAVLDLLPEGGNVLVTLDCDALDPAIMPAVAGPAPGGLTYDQVTGLIAGTVKRGKLVGFAMVEFVAERDHHGVGALTAANVLVNVIGSLAKVHSPKG